MHSDREDPLIANDPWIGADTPAGPQGVPVRGRDLRSAGRGRRVTPPYYTDRGTGPRTVPPRFTYPPTVPNGGNPPASSAPPIGQRTNRGTGGGLGLDEDSNVERTVGQTIDPGARFTYTRARDGSQDSYVGQPPYSDSDK
jgi:hypothetical protein